MDLIPLEVLGNCVAQGVIGQIDFNDVHGGVLQRGVSTGWFDSPHGIIETH